LSASSILLALPRTILPAGGDDEPSACWLRNASTHSMIWRRRADLVKALVYDWHKVVARSGWLASGYLRAISALCRHVLSRPLGARIGSLVTATSIDWPDITFPPRSVLVGTQTEIRLIPHLGEFDQAVLFKKRLDYETPVFCWLERNAVAYDLVIEIGANVGRIGCCNGQRR
jgi:hypothetical protein